MTAEPRNATSHTTFIARVNSELGKRARAAGLPTSDSRDYVLVNQDAWPQMLWAPLRSHAETWIEKNERHPWIHNLRSSQAFAVNLFGPLKLGLSWAKKLWHVVFPDVSTVELEWPRHGDPLEETRVRRSRTKIDARIDYADRNTAIVEVKLTEPDFGACSSDDKNKNPYWMESCAIPFTSLEQLTRTCYLSRDAERDYFVRLGRASSQVDASSLAAQGTSGCPMRGGWYQIMRNLLMAQHVAEAEARHVRMVVVAPGPALHPVLHHHPCALSLRDHLRSIIKPQRRDELDVIAVEGVVESARDLGTDAASWAQHMSHWYLEPLRAGVAG